jgi:hypothetical protein
MYLLIFPPLGEREYSFRRKAPSPAFFHYWKLWSSVVISSYEHYIG